MSEDNKVSFAEMKGKKQVKEICLLLLAKAKVQKPIGKKKVKDKTEYLRGHYVKISGKSFVTKHYYYARQILQALRKQRRQQKFNEIIGISAEKKVTMIELVNSLFLGM